MEVGAAKTGAGVVVVVVAKADVPNTDFAVDPKMDEAVDAVELNTLSVGFASVAVVVAKRELCVVVVVPNIEVGDPNTLDGVVDAVAKIEVDSVFVGDSTGVVDVVAENIEAGSVLVGDVKGEDATAVANIDDADEVG